MHRFDPLSLRHIAPLLAFAAAILAAPSAVAQVGLGLAPMRLNLAGSPGQQFRGALRLSNAGSSPVRVRAELLDFSMDAAATPSFSPEDPLEKDFSCREWITVNPMETELASGQGLQVRYTISVPSSVSERSYHCAVGFTTIPTQAQTEGVGLQSAVRLVSVFYLVLGKPALDGRLEDIALEYRPEGDKDSWQAVLSFRNSGLLHFRPSGDLAVLSATGDLTEKAALPSVPVFPMRVQRIVVPLKTLSAGQQCRIRAVVDLGLGERQEGEVEVVAKTAPPR